MEYNGRSIKWADIRDMEFYYRGDRFWKSAIPGFSFWKSYYRYNNLYWSLIKGMNEKFIDKVQIDGDNIYLKIRNQREKEIFFKLKENAEKNGLKVTEQKTDFSYRLFGKVCKY